MNRISIVVAAMMLGLSAAASAAEVTGVLVDLACYTKDKANTTNAHAAMDAACAQACARNGNTVALVTEKGEVYEVMTLAGLAGEKNAKLVPHMSHTVTLTGDVVDAKGKKTIHATALKMVKK